MAQDVPLKCSCGAVKGTVTGVTAKSTNHLICHCADCQAFVNHLGGEALGPLGGVQIMQVSPGRIILEHGQDQIKCLKLTGKGLMRWYTGCCQTPIGATPPSGSIPSLGMIHSFIDLPQDEFESVFGPVRGHVFTDTATGTPEEIAALNKAGIGLWLRMYSIVAGWKLHGDAKRHVFFTDGKPIVAPEIFEL